MRHRQQGITFIGLVCILALVGVVVYAGIRLTPIYLNYMKVARTMEMTALGGQERLGGSGPHPQHSRTPLGNRGSDRRRLQGHRNHQR